VRELQERRQHRLDRRRGRDHRLGDAGEHGDERRDGRTRVDQGGELAQFLPAAHLHRADLGDAPAFGRAAGRLQVDDHERRAEERARPRVVEEGVEGLLVVRHHAAHATTTVRHFRGPAVRRVSRERRAGSAE
jgi:hypothetical protein